MKRAAFASLCGVSKQMVSKYEDQGFVVVADGLVDVEASLAALEGRLDEGKRQTALQVMAASETQRAPTARAPLALSPPSAKAQKDEIELRLRQMEYGVKAGELVYAADVAQQAELAVTALRESFANAKRDIAAKLCAQFDVPGDKVTSIARFLGDQFEQALGRFATSAASLAKADADPIDAAASPAEADDVHADHDAAGV